MRSSAVNTALGATLRIHFGSPNSAQIYPGHGWQANSSKTISFGASVQGRQWLRLDEPKTTTDGVFTAAAMWAMPESLPTKMAAFEARAVISGKVRSSNVITGTFDSHFRSSKTVFSLFEVTATI